MQYQSTIRIQAEQWFSSSNPEEWHPSVRWSRERNWYVVETRSGDIVLFDNDFILTFKDGSHQVLSPDKFTLMYEPVLDCIPL